MSEITQRKCDTCGNIVEDRYLENGWLQIEGSVTRSEGRATNGTAITDYIQSKDENSDFCNIKCFVAALDAKKKKRERRTK